MLWAGSQSHKYNPEVKRGLRTTCRLILQSDADAKQAMLGHAAYAVKEGDFGDALVLDLAQEMPPHQW